MANGAKSSGRTRRKPRASAWAALLAVAALLTQALLPAAAMAAQASGSTQVELCTAQGATTVTVGRDGRPQKGFAGLPCQDCLAMAAPALVPPEPAATPTAYVMAQLSHAETADANLAAARALPRPPGQGPPDQTI